MSTTAPADFNQEPKKIFIAFLIKQLSLAHFYIYVNTDEARGLNVLDGIVGSLNKASQEALAKIHKRIKDGAYARCHVCARELYEEVSKYLANTYLEECNFAVVQTSTLPADKAPPKKEVHRRESARL